MNISSRSYGVACFMMITGLLLVACGGDSASNNSTTGKTSENTGRDALPGTEEFGLSKEGLVTNIESVEALIASCMQEAGFEYIAADYKTVRKGMTADKSLPGMGEGAFIKKYGFGISTLYTGDAPQLMDVQIPAQIGLGEKNIEIFAGLSGADQVAYNRTLLGDNIDATFSVSIEAEDFSRTGGCTRSAIEQVFTPEQLAITYLNPKDALIEEDPRMIAALAGFAECMQDSGFDYSLEREVEPDLKNRLDTITKGLPLDGLSADARTALTQLQQDEVVIANATTRCEAREIDPVEGQIERELFAGRQG